jgi:hypothetical protein
MCPEYSVTYLAGRTEGLADARAASPFRLPGLHPGMLRRRDPLAIRLTRSVSATPSTVTARAVCRPQDQGRIDGFIAEQQDEEVAASTGRHGVRRIPEGGMKMHATIRVRMLVASLAFVVGLLTGLTPSYAQTEGSERRQDRRDDRQNARDTRQTGREDARGAKAECKAGDEKTRAECRQDKRNTKQKTRESARDEKKD